jgi:neutral ceramidase
MTRPHESKGKKPMGGQHPLQAGFGRTDITPELGVRLGGYGVKKRPAEEILDPLHATATVLEQDGLLAGVVNLDWICIEEDVVDRLRRAASEATGIPPANLTFAGTHSHSVPNTLNFWGWGKREQKYIDSVVPEIVRAVKLAHDNLEEVEVGFATTESLVGVNRRGINEDGSLGGFVADPTGKFDPTMTVMRFRGASGEAGILVHYGAHGTSMGNNRIVSRDWCGIMKDRVEEQFSAPVVFLNGAIGDVGPRMNLCRNGELRAGGGDGVHSVREVGYRAAGDAIRALVSVKEWRAGLELDVVTGNIVLPYAPLTPLEEAEENRTAWEPQKDKWGKPMCEYMHACAVIEAHGREILEGRDFFQSILRIGPAAIVPMPGEMFADISLRIRRGSPFAYTLCCSVANGSLGYLPTREARHRGGYETWVGRAAGAYLLGDTIDDALVAENLRLLRSPEGDA